MGFDAFTEVFDETNSLCSAHGGLCVSQRAHLHSQNAQNTQGSNDDRNEGFNQRDAALMKVWKMVQWGSHGYQPVHGIAS